MMRLVCASANPDKVAEIQIILNGAVELLPRPDDIPEVIEDATSLIGNARLKARAICAASGLPAVADDTGLFVDALDGEPGVETAYFAGPDASYADNRAKMLHALAGVPMEQRTASFRTVVLVAYPDGHELAVQGVCHGFIAEEERAGRGFGYDPLFIPSEGGGRTFSAMDEDEKHNMSHRGRAFRALLVALSR
jgi:XTP/dITP diphosphohydrolase